MADVFTKEKRSDVMSRIRARGNQGTEIALARLLRSEKITGWRRHPAILGRPDFVFHKARVLVFVDGCFWHGCPLHCKMPTGNRLFWEKKLDANKTRDRSVNLALRKAGWRVVRIWEHDLKKSAQACIRKIRSNLSLKP